MSLSDAKISIFTNILRSRLTRSSAIGFEVVNLSEVDASVKLDHWNGMFIGTFHTREDNTISFLLCGRDIKESILAYTSSAFTDFTYIYVFVINDSTRIINDNDRQLILRFFLDLLDQRDKYKVGILNIRTRGHCHSYLSTLLDAVEFFSCRKLLLKFVPYQVIDTDVKDAFVGTR